MDDTNHVSGVVIPQDQPVQMHQWDKHDTATSLLCMTIFVAVLVIFWVKGWLEETPEERKRRLSRRNDHDDYDQYPPIGGPF